MGVPCMNFRIFFADMRSEMVESFTLSLVLQTNKLISGLVIPASRFNFLNIALNMIASFGDSFRFGSL